MTHYISLGLSGQHRGNRDWTGDKKNNAGGRRALTFVCFFAVRHETVRGRQWQHSAFTFNTHGTLSSAIKLITKFRIKKNYAKGLANCANLT